MLLAAAALAGFLPACVPARWFSSDPESLNLLKGTPINCLLIEARHWNYLIEHVPYSGKFARLTFKAN